MRLSISPLFAPLIISFALWLLPVCPATAATDTPTFRETLPCGLHLIVREMPGAATVALDLRVRSGSAADAPAGNTGDDPAGSGTAHFIEHLLFKGTAAGPREKPGAIDAAIEALGGEVDARTSRDWTQFAVTLPAGDAPWKGALAVLADAVLHPAFRPADIDAERAVVRGEMALARSEPLRLGYSDIYAAAFGPDDSYRLPLMGTPQTLGALNADALRAFWTTRYATTNLTLAVAGDIRSADVEQAVEAAFPALVELHSPAAAQVTVSQSLTRVVRAHPSGPEAQRDLATVVVGLRAPGAQLPEEMPALDVLMPLLFEGEGAAGRGRLYQELIVKRKAALAVTAEYLPGRERGLIVLTATGERRDATVLEDALTAEMDRLRDEPPTDEEVAAARASALADLGFTQTTPTGAARRLALLDALGLPPAIADSYADRVAAVTTDDVRRVAAAYINSGRYAVTVVGKTAVATAAPANPEVTP